MRDLEAEDGLSKEARSRLYERERRHALAASIRMRWTPEQHAAEAERLAAEINAFEVTRVPTPAWVPYQTRRPDTSHVISFDRAA